MGCFVNKIYVPICGPIFCRKNIAAKRSLLIKLSDVKMVLQQISLLISRQKNERRSFNLRLTVIFHEFLNLKKLCYAFSRNFGSITAKKIWDYSCSTYEESKYLRARPGFEPGTSRTLSENHTPRPTSHTWSP